MASYYLQKLKEFFTKLFSAKSPFDSEYEDVLMKKSEPQLELNFQEQENLKTDPIAKEAFNPESLPVNAVLYEQERYWRKYGDNYWEETRSSDLKDGDQVWVMSGESFTVDWSNQEAA